MSGSPSVAISQSRMPHHARQVAGVEDDVVEAVIAVNDTGRDVVGCVRLQPGDDLRERRHVPGPRLARTGRSSRRSGAARNRRPARCASRPAALTSTACSSTSRSRTARHMRRAVSARQRDTARQVGARDDPGNPPHHVEVAAEDLGVVAQTDHLGHVGKHRLQGLLDLELAAHVVRGLRLGPGGRATQDEVVRRVFEPVGPVGGAARVLRHPRHARKTGNAGLEECVDGSDIELLARADRPDTLPAGRRAGAHRVRIP